ncbi:aldose 1-epimerase family protein [Streptomyces poriticola]|uniref:aldose 1-epimerase family protein n=1 Tax=Streptomyces poriticola TaxID=3120506 RepID=UPI002FCE17A8
MTGVLVSLSAFWFLVLFHKPEQDVWAGLPPSLGRTPPPWPLLLCGTGRTLHPGRPSGRPHRTIEEPPMRPSPTGEQRSLSHGGHHEMDGRPLLDGLTAEAPIGGGRGQVLLPWPTRIGGGRYPFEGQDHQLPLSEPERGNAVHGLLRWTSWRLLDRADDGVRVGSTLHPQPGYPFQLEALADCPLGPRGLEVAPTATDTGDTAAPYGPGQHPYVTVGTAAVDEAVPTVPARHRLVTDEQGLPVGSEPVDGTPYDFRTARTVGDQRLDTTFTGLYRDASGRAAVRLAHPSGEHGVDVLLGESARCVRIYTGDTLAEPARRRQGPAAEAMPCPPDAFRSGTDPTTLEPGGTHVLRWSLRPWRSP